ncbi:MAG: hypothetical protein AAFQ37_08260, partial [Bacteroidota bacterium]
FRSIGNVTSLIGQLGLRGDYSSVVPGILSSSHPLANQEGRMHFGADTSYVQIKLEYDLIVGADTSSREVNVFGNQELNISFSNVLSMPLGTDFSLAFSAELTTLLAGIDLGSDVTAIAENLEDVSMASWMYIE